MLISSDADGVPNGLSGAAGALPQRLSRLRDGNLLDACEALLRRLLADLEQARSLPATECGHLFFDLTAPQGVSPFVRFP